MTTDNQSTEIDRVGEGVAARVLYDHREGALMCYDHPPTIERPAWCCVCGEHQIAIPWRWHVAHALWVALEQATHPLNRPAGCVGCIRDGEDHTCGYVAEIGDQIDGWPQLTRPGSTGTNNGE